MGQIAVSRGEGSITASQDLAALPSWHIQQPMRNHFSWNFWWGRIQAGQVLKIKIRLSYFSFKVPWCNCWKINGRGFGCISYKKGCLSSSSISPAPNWELVQHKHRRRVSYSEKLPAEPAFSFLEGYGVGCILCTFWINLSKLGLYLKKL